VIEFDLGGLLIDSPDHEITGAGVDEIDDGTVNGRAGRQLPWLLARVGLREVRAGRDHPARPRVPRADLPACLARLAGRDGHLAPRLEAWSERLRVDTAAGRFRRRAGSHRLGNSVNAGIDHGHGARIDHLVLGRFWPRRWFLGPTACTPAISATGLATTGWSPGWLDLDRLDG
jgi:hypothetical protein